MSKKVVQCTCLGSFGRFGNQLWQYVYAKAYAKLINAQLQIPNEWVGRKIFQIDEAGIERWCPQTDLDYVPQGEDNIDLFGYFQDLIFTSLLNNNDIRENLVFRPEWIKLYENKVTKPYTALHMRKGDYLNLAHVYCLVSDESFYKAAKDNGHFDYNLQVLTEENPASCPEADKIGAGFLPDFFTLMNSTYLYRSNSTFSWWAGFLGNCEVYSPVVNGLTGKNEVEFVKGNHPKIFSGHSGDILIKGYDC
jgi:hypothetical protein